MEQKGTSSSSSSSSSSRWNPTREQIAILEAIYRQGIRTPTAEQIQQITARLREFGGTEGKNVFYWFQNHKARQRQKLKHDRFAYFSRILSSAGPLPAPVDAPPQPPAALSLHHPHGCCSNVVCGPYCLPVPQVGGVGYYPNVFVPRPQATSVQMSPTIQGQLQRRELNVDHHQYQIRNIEESFNNNSISNVNVKTDSSSMSIETLQLFPLHPTGIVQEAVAEQRSAGSSLTSAHNSMEEYCSDRDRQSVEEVDEGSEDNKHPRPPPFFTFFG